MDGIGARGRVVHADVWGGTGRARIDGTTVDVAALRGGPLSCGDLVRVVALRGDLRVIDVEGRGEMLPLIAGPRRLRSAAI